MESRWDFGSKPTRPSFKQCRPTPEGSHPIAPGYRSRHSYTKATLLGAMSLSANLRVFALVTFLFAGPLCAAPANPDPVPDGLARSDWQSIRAAYDAGRHAYAPTPTGWQARNPGQQWTTNFDGRGYLAEPRNGGWQWGLE